MADIFLILILFISPMTILERLYFALLIKLIYNDDNDKKYQPCTINKSYL